MENEEKNICNSLSIAFDGLRECRLNLEKMQPEKAEALKEVADFYKVDEKEAIMLIIAIETHYSQEELTCFVGFNDIRETLGTSDVMKLIPYKNQIKSLVEKHYFFRNYTLDENMNFRISEQVLEALYKNTFEGISDVGEDFNDRYAFVRRFKGMYESHSYHTPSYKINLLTQMEKEFEKIDFVKRMIDIIPARTDRFVFYDCCGDFLEGNNSSLLATLSDIFTDNSAKRKAKEIADGNNFLIQNELLKLLKSESIADSHLTLSDKAKELLLEEDLCLYEKKFSSRDMINPEKINPVELFYSSENQKQIDTLISYLEPNSLKKIQSNLKEKGMRTGFAVLLHGAPGTGKTETVYQIAKKTNRSVIKVDVANSKSCWFGESEKLVKDIFDRYKTVCKRASDCGENLPILLFNEADAIFSKRKDVSSGNVAQTENAIQNIILDEMENLEGILIATTNLTDNFDSAFERRFLYKICFDYPSANSRSSIWASRISTLSKEDVEKLASYELSGGQIDNIVRKATMNEILTGEIPDIDKLSELCEEEKITNTDNISRIGFCI